jgi:hypothetical protein
MGNTQAVQPTLGCGAIRESGVVENEQQPGDFSPMFE